jgi:hypothetical protein
MIVALRTTTSSTFNDDYIKLLPLNPGLHLFSIEINHLISIVNLFYNRVVGCALFCGLIRQTVSIVVGPGHCPAGPPKASAMSLALATSSPARQCPASAAMLPPPPSCRCYCCHCQAAAVTAMLPSPLLPGCCQPTPPHINYRS